MSAYVEVYVVCAHRMHRHIYKHVSHSVYQILCCLVDECLYIHSSIPAYMYVCAHILSRASVGCADMEAVCACIFMRLNIFGGGDEEGRLVTT